MAKKTALRAKTPKPILLDSINVNIGVQNWYKGKLADAVQKMCADYQKEIRKAYTKGDNILAQDAKQQTSLLDQVFSFLNKRWSKFWADFAAETAKNFSDKARLHTDISMQAALKKHDFTLKFLMSKPVQTAVKAITHENVNLIKSIQSQYHTQVETLVWEAVKKGGDLGALTDDLTKRFDITSDRAKFIAVDQNNKARGAIEDIRRSELGIEEAVWIHSHAGRTPRQSHVDADGKRYKLSEGMLIDGEYIRPGEKINCRCTSRAIIPGIHDE